jgi:hypothetical protein
LIAFDRVSADGNIGNGVCMATTHSPQLRVIPGGLAGSAPTAIAAERTGPPPWWRNAEGVLAGYCVVAVATAAAVATGGTRHPLVALAVLAFALLVAASRMTLPVAGASGTLAWLFYDGFVIGRHGDLAWAGVREAWWLLALVAVATGGWALGHGVSPGGRPPVPQGTQS